MKKLLIIENSNYGGGSVTSLKKMITQIDREKYHIMVLALTEYKFLSSDFSNIKLINIDAKKNDSGILRFTKKITGRLVMKGFLPFASREIMYYVYSDLIESIQAVIKSEKIDIVITNIEPFRDLAGILASKNLNKPIISFIRSKYAEKRIAPPKGLIEEIDASICVYLPVSCDTSKSWVNMFNISQEKCYCIHDYIEEDNITVKRKTGRRLICVANLLPVKNYEFVLEATKKFLTENSDAILTVVGSGDRLYVEKIKKMAYSDVFFHERIFFKGYIEEPRKLIEESDFLLLLSHREGFPNVVLEAMRSKTLVIATRVGGIPEAIKHGTTGILVEPGDLDAVFNNLKKLSNDENKYNQIVENAYAICKERFSPENYKKKIDFILDSIASVGSMN